MDYFNEYPYSSCFDIYIFAIEIPRENSVFIWIIILGNERQTRYAREIETNS